MNVHSFRGKAASRREEFSDLPKAFLKNIERQHTALTAQKKNPKKTYFGVLHKLLFTVQSFP